MNECFFSDGRAILLMRFIHQHGHWTHLHVNIYDETIAEPRWQQFVIRYHMGDGMEIYFAHSSNQRHQNLGVNTNR